MKYSITDLDIFVEGSRVLVYVMFGNSDKELDFSKLTLEVKDLDKDQQEEIEKCLNQSESKSIALEYLEKKEDHYKHRVKYVMGEEGYMKFIESLNARLVSNILHALSNQGLLESAFDPEQNDFVFWAKDEKNKES